MKVAIDVKNREEAQAIKTAMNDPTARAATLIIGHLLQLPTDRWRIRTMAFVNDYIAEQRELAEPGQ